MYPRVFETFNEESPKIFSFQVGAMKPELSIYQKVTEFENIIYIEDRELYLKIPVEKLGWKGILFTEYIDETELIRSLHKNRGRSSWTQSHRVANSFTDIEECLLEFGIHI
jgi:FMN phosphatase YigB (HAD superfamily)